MTVSPCPRAGEIIGAAVLAVKGILLGFFMGIALNLCCAIVGEIVLSKWDGKIWRLLVFEIELLRSRIVPNTRGKEAE